MKALPTVVLAALLVVTGFGQQHSAERPEPMLRSQHAGSVERLEFSQSGEWLLSVSADQRAIVWNTATAAPYLSLPSSGENVTIAADGRALLVLDGERLTRHPLGPGAVTQTAVAPFAFNTCNRSISPDGATIAVASCLGTVTIRTLASGAELSLPRASAPATDIRWSGNVVAGETLDGQFAAYDVVRRSTVARGEFDAARDAAARVSVSEAKRDSGQVTLRFRQGETRSMNVPVSEFATTVVVDADARRLAYGTSSGEVRFIDVSSGKPGNVVSPDVVALTRFDRLGISPSGTLVTADANGEVSWWRGEYGVLDSVDMGFGSGFGISQNGRFGVVVVGPERTVENSDPRDSLRVVKARGELPSRTEVAVSDDGQRVAYLESRLLNQRIRIDSPAVAVCVPTDKPIRFAFSPDSKFLAFSCGNGRLAVLDVVARQVLPHVAQASVGAPVLFDPHSGQILTAVGDTVQFVNARNLAVERIINAPGEVVALAADPKVRAVAVTTANNRLSVYRVESAEPSLVSQIDVASSSARLLSFTGYGMLVSAGDDGVLRVWDATNGRLRCFAARAGAEWIAVSPDGFFDGSGKAIDWITWRRPSTGRLYRGDFFFNDLFAPGLLAMALDDRLPKPETGWDLIGPLRFPGLELMVQEGAARIERTAQSTTLCLSEPADELEIYLDGEQEVWDTTQFVFDAQRADCKYRRVFTRPVQVEVLSRHRLTPDARPKTPWDGLTVNPSATSRLHVQVIAADTYDLLRTGYHPLPGARFGAAALVEYFEKARQDPAPFAEMVVWPSLVGANASRARISERMEELFRSVRSDDVLLIYMAGHGTIPKGQGLYYFLPVDARTDSLSNLRSTAVSSLDLANWLRRLQTRRVVTLVDSCQSGAGLEALSRAAESVGQAEQFLADLPHSGTPHAHGVGFHLVASATPLQTAVIAQSGPSALVSSVIEGLTAGRAHGLTIRELLQRIGRSSASQGGRRILVRSIGFDFPIAGQISPAQADR